uniref:ZM domain-containing protein n=1 Tax=Schistosoma curassoni TaxID=6186 RepID=A0A183JWW4_9TREM
LRRAFNCVTRQALAWNPQGKRRRRGRPNNTLRREMEIDKKNGQELDGTRKEGPGQRLQLISLIAQAGGHQDSKCQNSSTVWGGNLDNYESHHPQDTSVYQQLSTQNTLDRLARHYHQQPTTVGENKPDPNGGRNQEEALEMGRTYIEESTQLHHKASPRMESSRSKEERKTK